MTALDKVRRRHAELLDPLYSMPDPAEAEIKLAIYHIDRSLSKPGFHTIDIKRARSARSYLRLILK